MKKAAQILRAHGIRALFVRAATRLSRVSAESSRWRIQSRDWRRLQERGASHEAARLPVRAAPAVSVAVHISGDVQRAATFLLSLERNTGAEVSFEAIAIVPSNASEEMQRYLASCGGLRVIFYDPAKENAEDKVAATALGKYIVFAHDRTLVTANWLQPLVAILDANPEATAVAPRLFFLNGTLAAAGGVMLPDGSRVWYGEGANEADSSYRYARVIDFCPDDFAVVRASASAKGRGGLDGCVLYQPASTVVTTIPHRARRPGGNTRDIEVAARRHQGPAITVIDSFVPFEDRDAGSRRLSAIVQMMQGLGYHVIFVPEDGGTYEPYASQLRALGVELRLHRGDAARELRRLPVAPSAAWICRPELAGKYTPGFLENGVPVIYDTVDLHYLRLQRGVARGEAAPWEQMKRKELRLMQQAKRTIVTSPAERELLRAEGFDAEVVPIIETVRSSFSSFENRRDVLFLGNFTHRPNVDAVQWLCTEIMPVVWRALPDANLLLVGPYMDKQTHSLEGPRVRVLGHIANLEGVFDEARVSVAPLRYGAGMKGKVVQSLANGLPLVTTTIGAEGVGLTNEADAIVADDEDQFANAIIRIYSNPDLWNSIAASGLAVARQFSPSAVRPTLASILRSVIDSAK